MANSNLNEKKSTNTQERIIGFIKFFDPVKKFGIIISSAKGLENNLGEEDEKLQGFYLGWSEWENKSGTADPTSNDWVVFTPTKTKRGWSAKQIEKVHYTSDDLFFAMKYRGSNARIKGTDQAGKNFDKNILCSLIKGMEKGLGEDGKISDDKKNSYRLEIIDCFCKYIADESERLQQIILKQFLDDSSLKKLLLKIFIETDYKTEDEAIYRAHSSYLHALIDSSLDEGKLSALSVLPNQFDLVPYLKKIVHVLITESCSGNSDAVEQWIKSHDEVLNSIKFEDSDANTIPLRLILKKITNDSAWLNVCADWNGVRNFLKSCNADMVYQFCRQYFLNKSKDYVENHQIWDLFDNATQSNWIEKLFKEENVPVELTRSLLEHLNNNSLPLWGKFLHKNYELIPSFSILYGVLKSEVIANGMSVYSFLLTCSKKQRSFINYLTDETFLTDELCVILYVLTGDYEYLNRMNDFDASASWLSNQSAELIVSFIRNYRQLLTSEEEIENDTYIKSLGDETVVKALKSLSEDEQFQFLHFLPTAYATDLVTGFFAKSKLFDLYVEEQWEILKGSLPYVVFDIESDGKSVREFAYLSDNYTHYYEDEGQLNTLINEINSKEIIVGHRIKEWDLRVLESHGKFSATFVWDTLEMEILLNPCRYAYSLQTQHNAKADTELTSKLFWNQLFRLSANEQLCKQLQEFLPLNISNLIRKLKDPIFSKFFEKTSSYESSFFQNLRDIDSSLVDKLRSINDSNEKTLVIAPKRLWNRIAQYVPLSFINHDNSLDYLHISEKKLREKPLSNNFLQTVLLRFCQIAMTPLVSNLAMYLRLQYFRDDILLDYVIDDTFNTECTDVNSFDLLEPNRGYQHIYFIGCELENRLNQFKLPTPLQAVDFWQAKSSIPMRLGGASYTPLTNEDRTSSLFSGIPKDAANAWIERSRDGNYFINYNFNISKKLKTLTENLSQHIDVERILWFNPKGDNRSIALVRSYSNANQRFDCIQKRVSSTSRYRAMYWVYQFALLRNVHQKESELPIIYILENDLELESVISYAQYMGFYVPNEGSLVSRLEKIEKNRNGLLVISRDKFFDVVEKRLHIAYCYVWDQMAVEKHLMMWSDLDVNLSNTSLNDHIDEAGAELKKGSRKDTYQSVLLSLWPVFQYYGRLIQANNSASRMYILDSFLEDYHTLNRIWNTSVYTSEQLWTNEQDFSNALEDARNYFIDELSNLLPLDDDSISVAMDVILATMVPESKDKTRRWSDVQATVLPKILCKKENYLVSIPTGGGKSVLFQGPALYNSSYTNRLSLVVTPLKALMQDQVQELTNKGFYTNVDYLNSDRSAQEVRSIYRKICSGELAILYVTPERFRSRAFLNALLTRMNYDNGLEYMVFDEAHCISQWGMEFRPEYLNVIKKCKELSEHYAEHMCIAMFSATVTDMIYSQINSIVPVTLLGQENDKKIYNPVRSHIGMEPQLVVHNDEARLDAIVNYILDKKVNFEKSRMLVFCKTRKQCEELSVSLAAVLSEAGILSEQNAFDRVGYFHAGMDADDREEVYSKFKSSEDPIYILCATKAFGMGMDIPNIHYIVHHSPPNVLEDYLQEVGRAGRNKEMYLNAGFSETNPIPTVCLYSSEDIKKARELLLQNMLSWNALDEIRKKILDFISPIQSLNKTKEKPVVVPNNLWTKSMYDHSYTDFKLGLYWLERLERIKLGYLSGSYITVKINKTDIDEFQSLKNIKDIKKIYKSLLTFEKQQSSDIIQVSPIALSSVLSMHLNVFLNNLILLSKYKLIEFKHLIRCRIANTRFDEVPFLLNNPDKEVAFHIIFNATKNLLLNNKLGQEKNYFEGEIRTFIDASALKQNVKIIRTSDGIEKTYMPWYNEKSPNNNKGLSIAKNYMKDLMGKRFRQIFNTLLDIIPDVKCKSYIDRNAKCVKQSILIEKDTWKTFLPEFKENCFKTLKYIYELQLSSEQYLNWADAINALELDDKGFYYFEDVIRYLTAMAYVVCDSLLPAGIEIYTTDRSEEAILENIESIHSDYKHKHDFDEANQIKNLRLCVMDIITNKLKNNEELKELISTYFKQTDANGFMSLLAKYYGDSDPIWDVIREKAIESEEEKLRNNPEQWNIYNYPSDENVNVEAGPGSGKTHVLTMKCAKLIYRQHVRPKDILVLAYNRAVVNELKSRLNKLFTSLGLSRSASQLNVYTFHGLAKRVCGINRLENVEMSQWETTLLALLKDNPNEITKAFESIKYILIDEFQDITQTRLDAIFELDKIFNHPRFFTIGDSDQSIYGFEKEESMDPMYYYEQLKEKINPHQFNMTTNYRSYPKILNEAAKLLPSSSKIPEPCKINQEGEPSDLYVYSYHGFTNWNDWKNNLCATINYLRDRQINDVAVFFRTNSEVYHGYSLIRSLNLAGVRIRIQGASSCELFRKREIYAVIKLLEDRAHSDLQLKNDETKKFIREKVSSWIRSKNLSEKWDVFYLDFAYTLVLDYLDFASNDSEVHTYGEMADAIKQSLAEDNPQLYKSYDKYKEERILQDKQMNVILTTMHKVKGLEFDAVIVCPSFVSLPFNTNKQSVLGLTNKFSDKEYIEEERRLLYVAFTRARKFLMVRYGPREDAVIAGRTYSGNETSLGIREINPGLDNYNIGFNACYNFKNNKFALDIRNNDEIVIERKQGVNRFGQAFHVYNILFKNIVIGQLSSSSHIARCMDTKNIYRLTGFFVSDVYYWSYQDSLNTDARNRKLGKITDYASKWCDDAIKQGYIFLISIAGYGC